MKNLINQLINNKDLKSAILRISLSLVFLYFGFSQVTNPEEWIGFVPEFLTGLILTANNIVMINGILELVLGSFMLIGFFTRPSSLILGINLLFIATSIGINPTGIRDAGLTIATFVIFLNGPDKYTIDSKLVIRRLK
ncbi:MAG: DoxX family protein [Nanoarchaeota archaeon]|nr:DoxX family protein [Nanoarchaeota archaeon]